MKTEHERVLDLLSQHKTLVLATVDEEGIATPSYAPFISAETDLYINVSGLSQHGRDLARMVKTSGGRADVRVMIIEDETFSKNLLARNRITFTSSAEEVSRDSPEWQLVMEKFKTEYGKLYDQILPLLDFTLYRLTISDARFVRGFGKAFLMSPDLRDAERITGASDMTGPARRPSAKKKRRK